MQRLPADVGPTLQIDATAWLLLGAAMTIQRRVAAALATEPNPLALILDRRRDRCWGRKQIPALLRNRNLRQVTSVSSPLPAPEAQ
jgi:hypothetical protein